MTRNAYILTLAVIAATSPASCGDSTHQINHGAAIPVVFISVNDFRDRFPQLPQSNAATVADAGKVTVYLTATTRDEAVRQALHEFLHVHERMYPQHRDEVRATLALMSSGRAWDAATCGPVTDLHPSTTSRSASN